MAPPKPADAVIPLPGESEAQFRLLADNIPGLCWLVDAEGRAYWMNRAGLDFHGGDPALALDPRRVVHPDDWDASRVLWRRALATAAPVEATLRIQGADGAWRPFLSRIAPIRDAGGTIVRWCGVQMDLTERHAHDRRQTFLRAFHDGTRDMTDPAAILTLLATMAFDQLGVDRLVYAEAVAGDDRAFCLFQAETGAPPHSGAIVRLGVASDALLAAARDGRTLVVADEDAIRAGGVDIGARAGIHVPIVADGRVAACLSLLGTAPRRWAPDEVELCEELAERVGAIVDRVRAEAKLKERERHQRFLIEWSDALRRAVEPDAIMRDTLARLGRHLGATRTTYSEADDARRVFTTRWNWCDGCASLAGTRVAMATISDNTEREWLAGDLVRYDDVTEDPRLTAADRAIYAGRSIAAFVSIPLIRDGAVRSILSVQSATARTWRDSELDLIRDMGERTWIALERARTQAELLDRERTQAFLIDWGDRVRAETRPDVILATTLERLGRHLGASRTTWSAIRPGGTEYRVDSEWCGDTSPTLGVVWPASDLTDPIRDTYLAGEPMVSEDLRSDDRYVPDARARYAEHAVVAWIGVPLSRGGVVQVILSIDYPAPRRWTRDEVQLVRDVADRAWVLLERARSEARLAESEALLAAFMEHAPLGMSLRDDDGRYLRLNPELARQIGVPATAAVGRLPGEVMAPPSALRMSELTALARDGEMASAEFAFPDRAEYAALLAVEFPIGGGGAARTGGFTLDLTARKAAEAQLAHSREVLYQAEKLSALGSLLAGVSHELNNPLSIVVAQAVMLERQGAGTDMAERAIKIRRAADRCARIVQTFLAMARQEPPKRSAVDLNAVAAAALELADYGLRSDGIAVVARFAPDLPRIAADADQLHQIIVNLVVNAHHAMAGQDAAGRRADRVLTLVTAPGPAPRTVTLDVVDTGPGVPADLARRIFEPFFTTKPQGQGTGVGLSFSLGLAEAHGGRLALLPAERAGEGARFRLTLPIEPVEAMVPDTFAPAAPGPGPTRRALIVDDEPEIAEVLRDLLALESYACEVATGGAAACAWLADGDWDLIVSDLRMPGMDGPELYAWLRRERPDLIRCTGFVTGDTLGHTVARFLDDVRRPVLEKPFGPDTVRRFLARFAG